LPSSWPAPVAPRGPHWFTRARREGVVTYTYKKDRGGPMFSGFRNDALGMMAHKCPSGYTILREGETRGYSMVSATTEGTGEVTTHRRWGLQFQCKAS
jgi:hypothetical protein